MEKETAGTMKFIAYTDGIKPGIALADKDGLRGLSLVEAAAALPAMADGVAGLLCADADDLLRAQQRLRAAPPLDPAAVTVLPPLAAPGKIICIGLNYADHSAESGFAVPSYPTVFGRFASGLIGHDAPMVVPRQSPQLDYEGELVAVIGHGGRDIPANRALEHVAGYSIFNDGSVRDYQFKSPQWTVGKNFDDTGAFGPFYVPASALPPGARGLRLQTRVNGEVVQDASTDDMIFDVATLIATLSEVMALKTGDLIVTGTPAGVGMARKPPLFLKAGDVCEVEVEGIGILRNPVVAAPTSH